MGASSQSSSVPRASQGLIGVLSLLTYLAGSVLFAFALFNAINDFESTLDSGLERLTFPTALVLSGAVLQVLRGRGESQEPRKPAKAAGGWRPFVWPVGLLVGPALLAWAQFELFRPRIYMWPLLAVIGGIWLGVVLSGRLFRGRYSGPAMMLLISVVTLPLALVSVALPTRHFRTHGSPVVYLSGDDLEEREYPFSPDLPDAPIRELQSLGPGTSELLKVFAEAKPVEGRMIDGKFHVQNERGEWVEGQTGSLDEMLERAEALDAKAEAAAEAAYLEQLEAHARRVDRISRSGRLFSSPD